MARSGLKEEKTPVVEVEKEVMDSDIKESKEVVEMEPVVRNYEAEEKALKEAMKQLQKDKLEASAMEFVDVPINELLKANRESGGVRKNELRNEVRKAVLAQTGRVGANPMNPIILK